MQMLAERFSSGHRYFSKHVPTPTFLTSRSLLHQITHLTLSLHIPCPAPPHPYSDATLCTALSYPCPLPHRCKHQGKATHSISTTTPFGNSFTATQLLAGLCVNHFSYSPFISMKFSIEVRKTVVYFFLSGVGVRGKGKAGWGGI